MPFASSALSRRRRGWRARPLWTAGLVAVVATLPACDNNDGGTNGGRRPNPPQNLASFTGDGEVILVWDPPTGDVEANSFNVYAFIPETGDFQVIGVTTSTAFLDNDVVNGQTYRYRVTALDNHNDESDFSDETFDTPRPDDFNVLLTSVQADPAQSAFDLTTARVVDASSTSATFRFEEIAGAFRIVPTNGAEVQDVGFVDALGDVNFAPESGYFPEAQQAFVGDAYIFRIPRGSERFFGVIRVSHLAPGILVFDWAFQTDEGNRELLRKPLD